MGAGSDSELKKREEGNMYRIWEGEEKGMGDRIVVVVTKSMYLNALTSIHCGANVRYSPGRCSICKLGAEKARLCSEDSRRKTQT